jgi:polyol transport system permease protein
MSTVSIAGVGGRLAGGQVSVRRHRSLPWSVLAWLVALIFFFPILWMVLTSLKPAPLAATIPPTLTFNPTLGNYQNAISQSNPTFVGYLANSAIATVVSTALVLLLALPAAYALSIRPITRSRDALFFFISTRFMPFAAGFFALYELAINIHLIDNILVLVVIYTSMNLPLGVWLLRSFMLEIPPELFEAARLDGANFRSELTRIVLPLIAPGAAATALICVIFAWNEFFYAVNLTGANAGTVPIWLQGWLPTASTPYYLASLSAAATLACLPVVLAGWLAQKRLVRGLTMGAVK